MNPNTMPLEAETRVLIDRSLENLGWKLSGKDQNVYYEQPRSEAEKPEHYQPHCGKLQIWAISVCVFWPPSSLYDLYLLYGVENRAN